MAGEPFFIVGCGRSGTTLLRGILNRHPQIALPLESLFIVDYLVAAQRRPLQTLIPMVLKEPELREWGISPTHADLADCDSIAQVICRLHEMYASQRGKPAWGNKTPRLVRSIPLLKTHFAGARFIHLVRDPRAVVRSLMRSEAHFSDPLHAAIRWRTDVQAGLAGERGHPQAVLRVQYEELVRSPRRTLERVLDFLGWDFVDEVLEPDPEALQEYSAFYSAMHANLVQRPSEQSIDRWRVDLTQAQVAMVESIAGDLMEALGYERVSTLPAPGSFSRLRMRFHRLYGMLRQLVHYLRYRPSYLRYLLWRKARLGLLLDFLRGVHY